MIGEVSIERAANGYIVRSGNNMSRHVENPPHVFETFDAMVLWLTDNLKGASHVIEPPFGNELGGGE
mgnify:CR=1 FL=1